MPFSKTLSSGFWKESHRSILCKFDYFSHRFLEWSSKIHIINEIGSALGT
ncbi:hypothetical protein LEP1GSC192_1561 [Leptospira sp. B5-022]|nr:hypothetical protein LEP1GSC192_1561 [Leptospira sp. B5-022]